MRKRTRSKTERKDLKENPLKGVKKGGFLKEIIRKIW